jgi:peptide/nickel transport system substrate-binding protein
MRFRKTITTKLKFFLRVLRAFSIQEKILGLVFLALFLYSGAGIFSSFFGSDGFGASGRYSEGFVGQFQRINPLFVDLNAADRVASQLVFSGLVKYSPLKGEVVPDLGQFTWSEDKKTLVFDLRSDVKWHDGQLFSADDVIFTFGLIQDKDFPNPILKANFDGVEVKKISESQVSFTLKEFNSFFISNLTVGILPQHLLSDVSAAEIATVDFNVLPVGTGIYKMSTPYQKYSDGRNELILQVNEDFYDATPKIAEIRLVTFENEEDLIKGKTQLNALDRVSPALISQLRNDPRFEFVSYSLPQYTALFLNMDKPMFKSQKLRIALQKSLDKKKLLELLSGFQAVDTPLMELKQDQWIYMANKEEAQGALHDAKYRYAKDGDKFRSDVDGEEFVIKLLTREFPEGTTRSAENKVLTDFVLKSWNEVGIQVEVSALTEADFAQALNDRNYDVVIAGQSLGYNLDTFSFWHSSQAEKGLNLSNYRSFAADKLIEAAREAADSQEKLKKLEDLAKNIAEDIPAIFLYRPVYYYVSDKSIDGVMLENMVFSGDKFGAVDEWKLN